MTSVFVQPRVSMKEAANTPGSKLPAGVLDTKDLQSRFVADNLRRIFLQIYRIVGNVEDAQDLTQETFIKALQRQDQVKDLEKSGHWLSRIASNTAIDYLRRHGRFTQLELSEVPDSYTNYSEHTPERLLLRAEQSAFLEDGLRLLSVRERTALVMRDVEGASAEEVAAELSCSKATVRSHISNARIKFRRYLERRRP